MDEVNNYIGIIKTPDGLLRNQTWRTYVLTDDESSLFRTREGNIFQMSFGENFIIKHIQIFNEVPVIVRIEKQNGDRIECASKSLHCNLYVPESQGLSIYSEYPCGKPIKRTILLLEGLQREGLR